MYDLDFEKRLLEISENQVISNLDSHINFMIKAIRENESSTKKVIHALYELSKEGKGIKIGVLDEYHILKRKEENGIIIVFENPIEQRFFDLSVYGEKFKGVVLRNKDSKELISFSLHERHLRNSVDTNLNVDRIFLKGIVTPTKYYHSHRGISESCFGQVTDELLDSMKFSFSQTITALIERLRLIDFDDTIAYETQEMNELCYFGNRYSGSMDNLNLRNSIIREVGRDCYNRLDEIKFSLELKNISGELHSYHKDCYCTYCTCIHLIRMDRSRIVTTDSLSKVIVDRRTFEGLLQRLDSHSRIKLLSKIDETKSKDVTVSMSLQTESHDNESVSDYIDNYLNDLLQSLSENHEDEVQECSDLEEQLTDIDEDIEKLVMEKNNNKVIIDDKPITTLGSTIEFLLGDKDKNTIKTEQPKHTQKDYDKAKEKIDKLDYDIDCLKEKAEEIRDNLNGHSHYDLYMWNQNEYSDSDVYECFSEEIHEIAQEWMQDRESDTILCDSNISYLNHLENSTIELKIKELLGYQNANYNNYEHLIIKTNGQLDSELWIEKIQADNTLVVNDLGELYIKQHSGVDMDKIRKTVSTFVGCGTLGSNLAYTMSRLGYRIFGLIDYDTVTLHNLPNQYYKHTQTSFYKVLSLKDNLLEILHPTTLPIIFTFETSVQSYKQYNGDIPLLMNTHTDVFFLVTDNLESRYDSVKWIKELSYETSNNYLIIDCRMNDLNKYVVYAYYIRDRDSYEKHLRTMVDSDGELIKLEDDNVCGFQSSILVAQKCSLAVIDVLDKHNSEDKIPFLTTNEFDY